MLFPKKGKKDFLGHMMIRVAKVFDCMKELLLSFFCFFFPLKTLPTLARLELEVYY
jgi:hypothetical protein